MKISLLTAITAAALVSGCSKKDAFTQTNRTDTPDLIPATEQEKTMPLKDENIRVVYEGLDKPNFYRAKIKWQERNGDVIVSMDDNTALAKSIEGKNEVVVPELKGGEKRYAKINQTLGNQQFSLAVDLKPPKDLVLEGAVELDESIALNEGRLFLTSTALLYTRNRTIDISVPTIYVQDGAVIKNFPEQGKEATADFDKNGLSGGSVTLKSAEAIGKLRIVLNGQRGGDGRIGWSTVGKNDFTQYVPDSCNGNSGGNGGNAGTFILTVDKVDNFIPLITRTRAPGGAAGHMNRAYIDTLGEDPGKLKTGADVGPGCSLVAKDGQAGTNGWVCLKLGAGAANACN